MTLITEFLLNNEKVNISDFEGGEIVNASNRKWYVDREEYDGHIYIRFMSLTKDDVNFVQRNGYYPEVESGEIFIQINYEYDDIFICEYSGDLNDFNGYKHFETLEDAFKWCSQYSNDEVHKILSEKY